MTTLILTLFSLFSFAVSAAEIPSYKVDVYHSGARWELVLTPPQQHHFNIKAPFSAKLAAKNVSFAPAQVTEAKIRLKTAASVTETDEVVVSAFLCDDAKTYCVKKIVNAAMKPTGVDAPESTANEKTANPVAEHAKSTTKKLNKKDHHGFWNNNIEAALSESQKTQKPLMIDFYGIWCPPCNQFNENVFPTQAFQQAAKNFVLLKVDADAETSWSLKSHFKIGGYPTIVFVKAPQKQNTEISALEEIDRVVGYFATATMVKRMNDAHESKAMTFEQKVWAHKDRFLENLKKLVELKWEQKAFDEAKKFISEGLNSAPNDLYFRTAMMQLEAKEKSVSRSKKHELLKVIDENRKTASTETLLRAQDLAISNEDFTWAKNYLDELELRVNPKTLTVDGYELSTADIHALKIDLAEASKDAELEKKSRQKAIQAYRDLIKLSRDQDSRGLHLELAYLLYKNGDVKEAKEIYSRFIKKYPKEFTFYYAAARMYLDLKELDTARAMAEKAVQFSYGDNHLRSVERLVRVMIAQGQGLQAKERGYAVLAKTKDPTGLAIRTDRYIQALKKAVADASTNEKAAQK